MTREEAINELTEELIGINPNALGREEIERYAVALHMAIQALKEMSVEEYRQRLMEVFHCTDHDELITYVVMPKEEEFKSLEYILQKQPLEPRPHGKWIPVSERLPEEDEDIIITHLGDMKKPIVDVSYFDGDFRSEDGEAYFSEVIAWMPLPEPYKTESEG